MYTVTFYSFRGGVGRTLALMNVAAALATRGKRVVILDFDLEAPGVSALARPTNGEQLGILDFVTEVTHSGVVPDVKNYVFPWWMADGGGQEARLWLMPSGGTVDASYGRQLNSFDWSRFYSDFDGYLVMEDLKTQLRELTQADYLLIDSRTGHTDIGGVCTRHLPDAVVAMFVPNLQNLTGIAGVIQQIRNENTRSGREIAIHYVPSNVPDLDDEDGILADILARFERELGYSRPASVIHHYDSLRLLQPEIFTTARPKSQLSIEYHQLLASIIKENIEDRQGTLSLLASAQGDTPTQIRLLLERKHGAIVAAYADDGEVLFNLSLLVSRVDRLRDALRLADDAVAKGYDHPVVHIFRARWSSLTGEQEARTIGALQRVLKFADAGKDLVREVVFALAAMQAAEVRDVGVSPAFKGLRTADRLGVLDELLWEHTLHLVPPLLFSTLADADDPAELAESEVVTGLCFVALGLASEFEDFLRRIGEMPPRSVPTAFNLAMARWATHGTPDSELMRYVVAREVHLARTANVCACLAMANWSIGDSARAAEHLAEARRFAERLVLPEFSPWRYAKVVPADFMQDLGELEELLGGAQVIPRFIHRNASNESSSSANLHQVGPAK